MVRDVNAGGAFTVARKGVPNTVDGTLKVKVEVAAAGRARRAAHRGSLLKKVTKDIARAGRTSITLEPTAEGLRQAQAQRDPAGQREVHLHALRRTRPQHPRAATP